MQLYFKGHQERYAVEQSLLMLFPHERPVYVEKPSRDDGSLSLVLHQGSAQLTAVATLRWEGKRVRRLCRTGRAGEGTDEVLVTRTRRRLLQRSFYLAATELLGWEPPWGMLSGVRPVKIPVRAMLAGKTPAQAARLFQRDYHVSPPRAALAMDCARFSLDTLKSLDPKEISLYVGIPFCPSRCAYCSFISAAGENNRLIPPYLEALLSEIETAGAGAARQGLRVRSVYIGGGTPTTLSAPQLRLLLSALGKHFSLAPDLEFTVEAGRPDTITAEKLSVLRQHGANRISLNPQTMSDEVLQRIGRDHSAADILRAFPLLREVGFSAINMDLIAGLPGDDEAGFSRSLGQVLALAPENITVHTLALKRGARLNQDTDDQGAIPTASSVAAMLDAAWQTLRAAGYLPYYLYRQKFMSGSFENIGWCKPGYESIYNICMMEELHSVLSLGAGAISKTVNFTQGSLARHANPKYPQDYIRDLPRILQEKAQLAL